MRNRVGLNYKQAVFDEICLEGLDGITLQALWLRLEARPGWGLGVCHRAKVTRCSSKGVLMLDFAGVCMAADTEPPFCREAQREALGGG